MNGLTIVLLLCASQLVAGAATKEAGAKKTRPVIVGPSRLYEHVGANVTFECALQGADTISSTISWWFNNERVADTARLTLTRITSQNAGTYTCRAIDASTRRSYRIAATLYVPNPDCVSEFTHGTPGAERYYSARWWPEGSEVVFDIEANAIAAKHWIGVGFSRDGSLPESDLIVGWVEKNADGRFRVQDRHVGAVESQLVLDRNQTGLTLIYGRTTDGVTRLQFRRRADLRDDAHDADLTACHYFFYLWRGTVLSVAKIRSHEHAVRSNERICPTQCPKEMESARQLVISQPFLETTAKLNGNVDLPFQIAGADSCPDFTLKHDGRVILSASFDAEKTFRVDRVTVSCSGAVSIENVKCTDAGTYTLVASYDKMTATSSIKVETCQASQIAWRSRMTAKSRLKALLKLKSEGKVIFVKKNGQFLLPSDRITIHERLVRISPVFYYDSGNYTICFNDSMATVAPNQCACTCEEIELIVNEFPKVSVYTPRHFIRTEKHLHCPITCRVKGSPQPQLVWMRNGRIFYPDSTPGYHWVEKKGQLYVPCWTIADSARYTCMGTNGAGTDSKTISITVMKETEMTSKSDDVVPPTKPTLYQALRREPVYHRIQSQHSSYYVLLNVRNKISNPIDIVWFDYDGVAKTIATVQPNHVYRMHSYRTHPLVAMDTITKQWLTIDGQFPFYPNPVWREDVSVCRPYVDATSNSSFVGMDIWSPGNRQKVMVRFVNRSPRPVDLFWVHMNGTMMIMEKTLEPGQGISYNTYDSDVWMARDSRTGRSALINDSLVFPAPNRNETVTIVNVTEAKTCDAFSSPKDHLRDGFFVFGCRGIHVVDALDAVETNFIPHDTTVHLKDAKAPMCQSTTPQASPPTHSYENASSTHEWIGKMRSSYGKILDEFSKSATWNSTRYPTPCPQCNTCQWGQPIRACGKFIYVPEVATRRVYVIDVATEEIVDAIQLTSIPYKVQFVERREEIWIHAYDTPTLMVVKSACRDEAKIVVAAEERPNKVMPYNVIHFGYGIRGRTDTALVTSPHDSKIVEFNLETRKFGPVVLETSCMNTFGMAYSPLNGHAFVSCFRHTGACALLEIDTLTMRVIGETPISACGFSFVSPDGHYVVTLPQLNPDVVTNPDVVVSKVSEMNGKPASVHCSVSVNDSVGYYFPSRPTFVATPTSWDVYLTFKTLDKVLKVSLSDCGGVSVLEGFGDMMCSGVAGKRGAGFSVGGLYARFMDIENFYAGRFLGTPARDENRFVMWDGQEEKVKWVWSQEMEMPYYVVATGPY